MKHKKGEDINGWLIVDKPRDMGSTQVVNLTRRLFNAKKNGHAGTLDPFATGILPIAFGEATKLLPYVTDGRKEYEFVIQWGKATNTDDSEGGNYQRIGENSFASGNFRCYSRIYRSGEANSAGIFCD